MNNAKAWALGLILGFFGIIISASLFVYIVLKTEVIFGILAVACGAISGGAVGLGYRLGKGTFKAKKDVTIFLWVLTLFGLLGMLAAYFGPYFLFMNGLSFSLYFTLIEFGLMDAVFILIGALGGRWAGTRFAQAIILKEVQQQAMKHVKEKAVKNLDKKFK